MAKDDVDFFILRKWVTRKDDNEKSRLCGHREILYHTFEQAFEQADDINVAMSSRSERHESINRSRSWLQANRRNRRTRRRRIPAPASPWFRVELKTRQEREKMQRRERELLLCCLWVSKSRSLASSFGCFLWEKSHDNKSSIPCLPLASRASSG